MTIYLHQRKNGSEKRLIRASHPSRAMSYVAKKDFLCEAAAVDTVVELIQSGVKIEDSDEKQPATGDMFNGNATTYEQAGGE